MRPPSKLRVIAGGAGDPGGGGGSAAVGKAAAGEVAAGQATPAAPVGFATAVLHELYTRYGGSVYGRCHFLLRDPVKAEDAMQDVFAKALGALSTFRAEASPLTWLMTIATNHCLNLLRSDRAPWRSAFEREELVRAEAGGGAPSGTLAGTTLAGTTGAVGMAPTERRLESREVVRKLLSRVDTETQMAAIHYFVDEMTLDEVAQVLGRSVPTVRKRLEAFTSLAKAEGWS